MSDWKEIEPECFEIVKFVGSQWREAKVLRGGNGLWTAYVNQYRVKLTKLEKISRNPILIQFEMMNPQSATKSDAMIWAERVWSHFPEFEK